MLYKNAKIVFGMALLHAYIKALQKYSVMWNISFTYHIYIYVFANNVNFSKIQNIFSILFSPVTFWSQFAKQNSSLYWH